MPPGYAGLPEPPKPFSQPRRGSLRLGTREPVILAALDLREVHHAHVDPEDGHGVGPVVEGALGRDGAAGEPDEAGGLRDDAHAAENLGRDDARDAEHRPAAVDHLGVGEPLGVDETAGALGVGHAEGVEAEVAGEGAVEVRHVLVGDAHHVEVILLALLLDDSLGSLLGGPRPGGESGDGWDGERRSARRRGGIIFRILFSTRVLERITGTRGKAWWGGDRPARRRGAPRCRAIPAARVGPRELRQSGTTRSRSNARDRTGRRRRLEPLSAPSPAPFSSSKKKNPPDAIVGSRGGDETRFRARPSTTTDETGRACRSRRVVKERVVAFHGAVTRQSPRRGRFTRSRLRRGNLSHLALGAADEASLGSLGGRRGEGGAEPKVARAPLTARTAVTEEVVMAAIVCAVVCA